MPREAMREAGRQLCRVQQGNEPNDWKPMATIGPGVRELRVWISDGSYRVVYYVRSGDCVLILHAFKKTSQATLKRHIELARKRLKEAK